MSKRKDYLSWDQTFMTTAMLFALRSKDPSTQVGACIVNLQKKVVGIGYNGFPNGCSDDIFPWNKDTINNKYLYVVHAEENAILNSFQESLEGATIYCTLFPCNKCAQAIVQKQIKHVVYLYDKYHDKIEYVASRKILDACGVDYRRINPSIELNKTEK